MKRRLRLLLRFVMPHRDDEEDPKEVELRIESYLQDSKQVFVEARFTWLNPTVVHDTLNFRATERLGTIEDFIENQVHQFMEAKS